MGNFSVSIKTIHKTLEKKMKYSFHANKVKPIQISNLKQ